MKILVDNQIFSEQRFGGISRYFVEVLNRMPPDIEVDNSTIATKNKFLKDAARKVAPRLLRNPAFLRKRDIATRLNNMSRRFLLRRNNFDVFHPTYYDPYFLQWLKRPYVITVHDMTLERFPELFGTDDPLIEQRRQSITQANRIIAISECTKKDVVDIYGIDPGRIDVIYHGHSMVPELAEEVEGLPDKYVLYVGQRYHYKNFTRFLEAFSMVHRQNRDLNLVCTGVNFNQAELEKIRELGIDHCVASRFVTDRQLAWLYSHAQCFVFPSLYEGFGIPILEAFACNCPVLLSRASCFPEIAGDAALYFDPYDVDDMARTITTAIENPALRHELTARGKLRLADFSWERTAEQTANLYRSMS